VASPTVTAGRTVRECVQLISDGQLTSEQLITDCLQIIDTAEPQLGAWASLDREQALAHARDRDVARRRGSPLGALHGIPVGIKDIYDTADLPTERGSSIYAGRQPDAHAAAVEKLIEAGAVILGKTVSTELAYMHPAGTRNPHNLEYSPGGSSSGSAAAVAAGHVPLALGSQTGGSVIRPASFCGVYGFKPSRGIIPRRGVLQTSPSLDQMGVFARDAADLALLTDVIKGYDATDAASYLAPRPRMLDGYLAEAPIEPNFVWIDMPYADRYSENLRAGFEELLDAMGGSVERMPAPQSFAALTTCHKIIYDYEIYRCFTEQREQHWEQLSKTAQAAMEHAASVTDAAYQEALEIQRAADDWFEQFFHDYDAIVTPSATGEPPAYGDGTGDPICCVTWTLCGLPCVSLPLLAGHDSLPIGVQLVGSANGDDRLLRSTRWLLHHLQ